MTQIDGTLGAVDNGVCGLLVPAGRALLLHRSASKAWAPNCWDAPGGHPEAGESDVQALAREIDEELAVTITASDVRLVARLTGADFDVRIFIVDRWTGDPMNAAPDEHDDIGWFDADEVGDLEIADPDLVAIIRTAIEGTAQIRY